MSLPASLPSGSHGVSAGVLAWDNIVSREREVRTVGSMWSTGLEGREAAAGILGMRRGDWIWRDRSGEGLQLAYLFPWLQ